MNVGRTVYFSNLRKIRRLLIFSRKEKVRKMKKFFKKHPRIRIVCCYLGAIIAYGLTFVIPISWNVIPTMINLGFLLFGTIFLAKYIYKK